MKTLRESVAGRPRVARKMLLATALTVALLGTGVLAPTMALAQTPVSDPYAPTPTSGPPTTSETSTSETSTSETSTSETSTSETSTSETSTSETSTSDTSTSETSTSDTSTSETSTSDTSTSETSTSDTSTSDTSTSETSTSDTSTSETTPTTETTDTNSTTGTTPAEVAVFDPGPCLGAFVTASGSGFSAGEPIDLQRDGVTIVTVPAQADGTFSVRVDIAGVQNGLHVITATGTLSGFSASGEFDVEPQVCTTDTATTSGTPSAFVVVVAGSSTPLASTGFPVATGLAVAILALVAGTMLLLSSRYRRGARASAGADLGDGPRHQ